MLTFIPARIWFVARIAVVTVAALAAVGCQSLSPTQRYALMSDSYSAAVEGVTDASRLGLVDVEFLQDFDAVRRPAREGLDEWEAALLEESTVPMSFERRLSDWIDRMILMQLEAKKEGEE